MVGDGLIEDGAATEDGATAEVGIELRDKGVRPLVGQSPSREPQVGGHKPAMLSRLTTRSLTPFSE